MSGASTEFPCPDCGEKVREGLVRCWNCGGFLRPDVEKTFQKIRSRPTKIIYSPATAEDGDADLDSLMPQRSTKIHQEDAGDFELGGGATSSARPLTASTPAVEMPLIQEPTEESSEVSQSERESADQEAAKAQRESAGRDDEVAHSIATGGDALLELAAQEEQERGKRQSDRGTAIEGVKVIRDGFLIDAPKGCRIQVRDEKTGELRRLTFGSSSRVRVSLLDKLAEIAKAKKEGAQAAKEDTGPKHLSAGVYQRWLSGIRQHTLNPEKLKLKADSMASEFVPVEIGFADDSVLVASLPTAKKAGLFGSSKGKGKDEEGPDPATRLLEHFRAGKTVADAPVGDKKEYSSDQVAELRVVQPAASLTESLFAGIPVFGTGRIAVQLPHKDAGTQPRYLSFTISEFREFAEILGSLYSMGDFGHNMDIPLSDTFSDHKCHYSNVKIRAIEGLAYYEADPKIDVVLAGWLCTACGIAISEDAREKEKLGGKGGKGIAKAKCPKCGEKMGSNPLYTLPSAKQSASLTGEESEDETPDAG